MAILIFVICLLASMTGSICGIGGGVIIKPVLDALGIMSVSAISFLSGLTVLSMSVISVFKQRKLHLVDFQIGSLLAIGSVVGGIVGNTVFHALKTAAGNDHFVGMVQALVLALITLMTLIYNAFLKQRLPSYRVQNALPCTAIGSLLGILSAFLGIGGGPINLAVLNFAFSFDTKKSAANSLYIIMCSQISNFLTSCVQQTIPEFPWIYLLFMVSAGVIGGFIGADVNKKISSATTDKLFSGLLCVIILICFYNVWRFTG